MDLQLWDHDCRSFLRKNVATSRAKAKPLTVADVQLYEWGREMESGINKVHKEAR
jgi:hypothetical protein